MGVRIQGHRDAAVTECFHYHAGGDTLRQQEARAGVPEVVEPHARQFCPAEDSPKASKDIPLIDRVARGRSEYEPVVRPFAPGGPPLIALVRKSSSQTFHSDNGQHDCASAPARLRFTNDLTVARNPLKRLVDPHLPAVQVDISPLKRECFTQTGTRAHTEDDKALHLVAAGGAEKARCFLW